MQMKKLLLLCLTVLSFTSLVLCMELGVTGEHGLLQAELDFEHLLSIPKELTPFEAHILAEMQARTGADADSEVDTDAQADVDAESEAEVAVDLDAETEVDAETEEEAPSLMEVSSDQWWLEKAPWFLPPPPEWGKMPVTMYTSYYHKPTHPHHNDYAHGIPLPDAEALNLARRTYPQPPFEQQADASFLETSSESDSDTDADAETDVHDMAELQHFAQTALVSGNGVDLEVVTDAGADSDAEAESETEMEGELEADMEVEAEAESEAENEIEGELEAEAGTEGEAEAEDEPAAGGAFLEVLSAVSFTPDDVNDHKSSFIGKMRHERTRAKRVQNKRLSKPGTKKAGRDAVAPGNFGPHDERREPEEAREFSADTNKALDIERKQRTGTVRPIGTSRAPFCSTYPWCSQTPPPPALAGLPPSEDPAFAAAEMARLDPLENLPVRLEDLKKDAHRFGLVFQSIYNRNKHNEALSNKHGNRG